MPYVDPQVARAYFRCRMRRLRLLNPGYCQQHSERWAKEHPLRRREVRNANAKRSRPARASTEQARRARKLQACPPWAKNDPRIVALYEIADWLRSCGDDVQVDHLFPLKPRTADAPMGLHVYRNLRIIGAGENQKKTNHQPSTLEIAEQRQRDFHD